MKLVVVPASAHRIMPWKIGRGSTTELCTNLTSGDRAAEVATRRPRDTERAGEDEWSWRLSIADVPEAGPFSKFEGVDRLIACVSGEGMRVRVDGAWHDVPSRGAALAFRGEAACEGAPVGSGVRDINLMTRRSMWSAAMAVVLAGDEWSSFVDGCSSPDPFATWLVHALDAPLELGFPDRYLALKPGETAVVQGATPCMARRQNPPAAARTVVARLQPLDAARVGIGSSGT